MCFLSSSGGFQSGEVLSLCGSEVRALRLRRQTGEFQIKNVPSTHFFLICVPSHEPVDHPPRYTSLCLLPAKLSFTLRSRALPDGRCHSLICMHRQTHTRAPAAASPVRSVSSVSSALLFPPKSSLCVLNWNWLELKRLALMPGIIHRLDRARMGRPSWLTTEKQIAPPAPHRCGFICCVSAFTGVDWCVFCQRRLLFPCVHVQSSTMRLSSPLKVKAYALIFRFVSKQGSGWESLQQLRTCVFLLQRVLSSLPDENAY